MLYVGRARVRTEKFHQLGPERGELRLAGWMFVGAGAQCVRQILKFGMLGPEVSEEVPPLETWWRPVRAWPRRRWLSTPWAEAVNVAGRSAGLLARERVCQCIVLIVDFGIYPVFTHTMLAYSCPLSPWKHPTRLLFRRGKRLGRKNRHKTWSHVDFVQGGYVGPTNQTNQAPFRRPAFALAMRPDYYDTQSCHCIPILRWVSSNMGTREFIYSTDGLRTNDYLGGQEYSPRLDYGRC